MVSSHLCNNVHWQLTRACENFRERGNFVSYEQIIDCLLISRVVQNSMLDANGSKHILSLFGLEFSEFAKRKIVCSGWCKIICPMWKEKWRRVVLFILSSFSFFSTWYLCYHCKQLSIIVCKLMTKFMALHSFTLSNLRNMQIFMA